MSAAIPAATLYRRLDRENLTLFSFSILGQCREAARTVGELADSVKAKHQHGSWVVDSMTKRGLLRKERDQQDQRKVFVHITDAGKECLGRVEG